MEIVVHNKKSLFQQKFQKKLCHCNRNSQLKIVMKNDPIMLLESDQKSDSETDSDS